MLALKMPPRPFLHYDLLQCRLLSLLFLCVSRIMRSLPVTFSESFFPLLQIFLFVITQTKPFHFMIHFALAFTCMSITCPQTDLGHEPITCIVIPREVVFTETTQALKSANFREKRCYFTVGYPFHINEVKHNQFTLIEKEENMVIKGENTSYQFFFLFHNGLPVHKHYQFFHHMNFILLLASGISKDRQGPQNFRILTRPFSNLHLSDS